MRALLALALCSCLPAQTIRVTNNSPYHWNGWLRTYVDVQPPYSAGWTVQSFDALYVVGQQTNEGEWPIDIRLPVLAGQTRDVAIPPMAAVVRPVPKMPFELGVGWGALPRVNQQPFYWTGFEPDGAGVRIKCYASYASTWHVNLDFLWFPETQGFLEVAVRVRAADYSMPALQYSLPQALGISWGTAYEQLLPQGYLANHNEPTSMTRIFSWPSLMRNAEEVQSAMAIRTGLVSATQL